MLRSVALRAAMILTAVVGLTACAHWRKTDSDEKTEALKPQAEARSAGTQPLERNKPATSNEASAEYHFQMAQAYVAEGNSDRAIEEYKAALMHDPNSALLHARLAAEHVKKGNLAGAMESCKAALQCDPNFIDARLMLAGLYSATRDHTAALAEYDRVLKTHPNHEETVLYKSQVLSEQGRDAESVQLLNSFVRRSPESALGWYYLGRAEQKRISTLALDSADEENPAIRAKAGKKGDADLPAAATEAFKRAVAAYRRALEIRPSFSQAALSLGFLYEARQMNEQAIVVYKASYDEGQDLAAANRLTTLLLKLERFKEAVPFLEAVASSDPDDMNVRVKLGLVQMELKNYEKAIVLFKGILEKAPDSDRIRYYLGSLYEELKDYASAIEHLRKIPSDSRLYSDATLHIAYLYKQDGKVAESRAYVESALRGSPRNVGFYLYLASLDEETREYAKAIAILHRAVSLFPEDEKARYYLGSMYDRVGKTEDALIHMESILSINPENVDALNYIGYTWTTQGVNLERAEKLLKKAITLKPDNGYIQDSWGWYLFTRGRMKEAVVELEKAVKLKPNESTILEHLAEAYLRNNLREKALHHFQLALQFAEDPASRQKLDSKIEVLRGELARERPRGGERLPAAQKPAGSPPAPTGNPAEE